MSNLKTTYVAIDIEKAGKKIDDAILAIGLCVGSQTGQVIEKRLWCLEFPEGKGIEEQCNQEFWMKYPELLKFIRENAKPIVEVMTEFAKFIDDLESKYQKIVFVSDNPAFDIGAIDYYLHKYVGRCPMRYTKSAKYCCISDPSERLEMLVNKKAIYEEIDKIAKHSHKPDDDAEYIYHMQIAADKYKQLNCLDWFVVQTKDVIHRIGEERIIDAIRYM